jgi:hypothetical protein
MSKELLSDVNTWASHKGKREYVKFLKGNQLTHKETCLAMCYQCTAGYFDGREKCDNMLCPAIQYHPFTDYTPEKGKKKRERSAKQIEASKRLAARMSKSTQEIRDVETLL